MSDRNEYKIRKQVDFWKDDLAWLDKTHPGASLSWLVNTLIHSYREICENPEKYRDRLEDLTIFSTSKEASLEARKEIKETYK